MSLVNKKTNNVRKVVAVPTESGNGFVKGREYAFYHKRNGLYVNKQTGYDKFEDFGKKSAHLWDGHDWDAAGHFEIISQETR